MYRGGPKVTWYVRKVRHAKRGVRARACPILASFGTLLAKSPCILGIANTCYDRRHQSPILASFGKILPKNPMFLEIGNMWYDGRDQRWGP